MSTAQALCRPFISKAAGLPASDMMMQTSRFMMRCCWHQCLSHNKFFLSNKSVTVSLAAQQHGDPPYSLLGGGCFAGAAGTTGLLVRLMCHGCLTCMASIHVPVITSSISNIKDPSVNGASSEPARQSAASAVVLKTRLHLFSFIY